MALVTLAEERCGYEMAAPGIKNIFAKARAPEIRKALRRVARHTRNDLQEGCEDDLKFLIGFLVDYPGQHEGTIVGLADKSVRWHQRRLAQQRATTLDRYGAKTRVTMPPIPTPADSAVHLLETVGEIHNAGMQIAPFVYLGAKHMVTGYDHLLFLTGVIFFLYKIKDVALYVTLFAVGHSTTLLLGVLADLPANPYLIDAIIGFSVVYKGFENLDGFRSVFGHQPNAKVAVLVFGFFHGFGLATKLQELGLSKDGLVENLVSFNVGVELGQFAALACILVVMNTWRASGRFLRDARNTNVVLMTAGFLLIGYQLTGYVIA